MIGGVEVIQSVPNVCLYSIFVGADKNLVDCPFGLTSLREVLTLNFEKYTF